MKDRTWQDTKEIEKLIHTPGKTVIILIHVNPDGDAIGSALGLLNLLFKMGHTGYVISPNDYPEFLKWMPASEKVIDYTTSSEHAIHLLNNADIIFAIDFNDLKRMKAINEAYAKAGGYKVLIDHHPDPGLEVDCMLSDIASSSTAELVVDFIKETGCISYVDEAIAGCLFTGIMTDTGCFSFNSSRQKTWESVAELLGYGINKDRIYSLVYDNFSANRMRLLGYSINEKMEVLPEFRTGYIWLTKEDLDRYHFETGDSEGFVNYPLSIKGIRFSALFIEKDSHVRISLRSKGGFSVNEFARIGFNGGGHANASGAESYMSLTDTVKRFRELLTEFKDELTKDEE